MEVHPTPKFGRMLSPAKDIFSEIRKSAKLGADFVEITLERPKYLETLVESSRRVRNEIERRGMFSTIHMAYWSDMGSEYESVRNAWMEECKKSIDAASIIGARKFLVHARVKGMITQSPGGRLSFMKNLIASLNRLSEYAGRHGIVVVVENEYLSRQGMRIEDFGLLARKFDGPALALDVGHAFVGNSNKTVLNFIRKLDASIEHIHFSDNNGKGDEHLPIGKGKIDYRKIIAELKRIRYGETITLEIFRDGDAGFSSSLRRVKRMWSST